MFMLHHAVASVVVGPDYEGVSDAGVIDARFEQTKFICGRLGNKRRELWVDLDFIESHAAAFRASMKRSRSARSIRTRRPILMCGRVWFQTKVRAAHSEQDK